MVEPASWRSRCSSVKSFSLALARLGALAAALAIGASGAGGTFVEHDVRVLHQFDSNGPAPGGSYFGWAVSELGDVDHDGVKEAIVGEPLNGADSSTGSTYVYSGRTGRLIYRFDGAPGDENGFSMADAGDTNGDHVHDILVGSPGNGRPSISTPGARASCCTAASSGQRRGLVRLERLERRRRRPRPPRRRVDRRDPGASRRDRALATPTVYSGRTYEPIRTLTGDTDRNQFGSGAGWSRDVDRDRPRPDRRRPQRRGRRPPDRLYIYSGRTGKRLFTIGASPHGSELGSFFVAGVGGISGDRTPDFYVGDYADDERDRRRRQPGRPRGRLLGT